MNPSQLDRLVLKASRGDLTAQEQMDLAGEFVVYRAMALRMEATIHRIMKDREEDR
jgi:hypothetical protein